MNKTSQQWNEFVARAGGTFLQSWQWGDLQQESGRKVWRLEGEGWQALLVAHALPFGMSYLYCPGGPVVTKDYAPMSERFMGALVQFLNVAKRLAKEEGAVFLKIEPLFQASSLKGIASLKGSRKFIQPQKTAVVDLAKPAESLLSAMHPKTRYNIGLARKHGVKVEVAESSVENVEIFWDLLAETARRDRFMPHPKSYYQDLLRIFRESSQASPELPRSELILAEHEGTVLAAAILMSFNGHVYYLHGASSREKQAVMAPHLLHWEAILRAKSSGASTYDFWGVDEKRWPGVTRFKLGFGGRFVAYVGSFDAVYKPVFYAGYLFHQRLLRPL